MSPPATASPSYWCYRCTRLVPSLNPEDAARDGVSCPYCDGGFVEQFHSTTPAPTMYVVAANSGGRHDFDLSRILGFCRNRRNTVDRSNQIIVLRRSIESEDNNSNSSSNNEFELYHDDGSGSGLRRVPASVSESLMNSSFALLIEQLLRVDPGGFGQSGNPPTSKSAIESIPMVKIEHNHLKSEPDCAICLESFELGTDAREMPCKHIYHENCIVPWLSQRGSCPICRHQIPEDLNSETEDRETVGLSIWPLPSGAFEVGRFRAERGMPIVFPEIDAQQWELNQVARRRISWIDGIRRREGGFWRIVRSIGSVFRSSRGGEDWVDVALACQCHVSKSQRKRRHLDGVRA